MKFPRPTVTRGDCIAQESCRFSNEYGRTLVGGIKWASHRLSYSLNISPIPPKPKSRKVWLVLHRCDNKWCINPAHLYLGDASQNAIDNSERNKGWREKRIAAQKKLGFPEVSPEGRARMAKANSERLKWLWKNDPEAMRRQRGI